MSFKCTNCHETFENGYKFEMSLVELRDDRADSQTDVLVCSIGCLFDLDLGSMLDTTVLANTSASEEI